MNQRPYNSFTPAPRGGAANTSKKSFSFKRLSVILFAAALIVAVFGVQNAQRAHARAAAAEEAARHHTLVADFNNRLEELSNRDPLVKFSVAISGGTARKYLCLWTLG